MIVTPSYSYAEIRSRSEKLKREKPELLKKHAAPWGARIPWNKDALPGTQTSGPYIKFTGGSDDPTLSTKEGDSSSRSV